jgi:predicted dehydrogenase
VRVAVVGTGFGERVVAPAFRAAGCEIVDVVTARDDTAVAALCRRPDVDLVAVHSPPFLHRRHVGLAVAAGKHVLCDKPFGRTVADAEAMVGMAEAAGVETFCNFEFRRDPVRERMRELVRDGAIGRPEHVQWVHISSGTRVPLRRHGWLFERDPGGGWIGAWASHAVDTLRWWLGEVVDVVCCSSRTTITERPDRDDVMRTCDAEDGITAALTLTGGVTVAIDSTFAAAVNLPPRIVISGSDGALENVGDHRLTLVHPDGGREDMTPAPLSSGRDDADRHSLPMRRWAAVIRDAIETGRPATPSFLDGLACRRVLDRMRSSQLSA